MENASNSAKLLAMNIRVDEGNWGNAPLIDIRRLLEDVASQFLRSMIFYPIMGEIRVQSRPGEVPQTIWRTNGGAPNIIFLGAQNTSWCQYAYQFAHEFCHLLCDSEAHKGTPNMWFQEAVCELASLFAIKSMAQSWRTRPPYPNWHVYAQNLDEYADEIIQRPEHALSADQTLAQWLANHEASLRANCRQRALNGIVAVQLLPLFLQAPSAWQSIPFLPNTSGLFNSYLVDWHSSCPANRTGIVRQVAGLFDVPLGDQHP